MKCKLKTQYKKDDLFFRGKSYEENMRFDSFRIKKSDKGYTYIVDLMYQGHAVFWLESTAMDFSAGDTLTFSGVEGHIGLAQGEA